MIVRKRPGLKDTGIRLMQKWKGINKKPGEMSVMNIGRMTESGFVMHTETMSLSPWERSS